MPIPVELLKAEAALLFGLDLLDGGLQQIPHLVALLLSQPILREIMVHVQQEMRAVRFSGSRRTM